MMQLLGETQVEPPFTGTFYGVDPSGSVFPFDTLAAGAYVDFMMSGTTAFVGGVFLDRPPIAVNFTGVVSMNYTSNDAANVWQGVSGVYVDFYAEVQRDYTVLATVVWRPNSANWEYEYFTLDWGRGAQTGVYPINFGHQRDANGDTNHYFLTHMVFILRDVPPGTYRVQLHHSPWGSSLDRYIYTSAIAVL